MDNPVMDGKTLPQKVQEILDGYLDDPAYPETLTVT